MNDILEYDSWSEEYKSPFGAIKINQNIKLTVKTNSDTIKQVNLLLIKDNPNIITRHIQLDNIIKIPMENVNKYFKIKFELNENILYFYFFEVIDENDQIFYYGKNHYNGKACRCQNVDDVHLYQITIYQEEKAPDWFNEGILYHVFVDRFYNGNKSMKIDNPKPNSFIYSNWDDKPMYIKDKNGDILRWDFYGGNLLGIIRKLDYLQELGITILYLSPIFKARSNHKYDTADYKEIDQMFGNERIFKKLIEECELRKISIILDGVFSHTGDDSIYFNKYGNYDSIGAYQSKESKYYSWYNFKNYPEDYDSWWGIKALPNVDELNPSFMDYIIYDEDSVLKKWMKFKIKGWRLDVADELPTGFIVEFQNELKKLNNESVLIGEVWDDASNKVSYSTRRNYFNGNQLDSVTGYPFRNMVLSFLKSEKDSMDLYNGFMTIWENYPEEKLKSNLNILGTHDVRRVNTELFQDRDLLKLAIVIQMTFEGVPYVYYGDEVGICGELDPDNRRSYPWGKEDNTILEFYKRIISIRKENKVFINGKTKFLVTIPDIFAYIRYNTDKRILIIINRGESDYNLIFNQENISSELIMKRKSFEILEIKTIHVELCCQIK